LPVDAVNALRPTQPEFAGVRRRAQQIEELAGLDRERLGRGIDHEVLVFGIDPVVGDDRAEGFLGRNMRLGRRERALAQDIGCRCKGPMRHMKSPSGKTPLPPSRYPRSVPKSRFFPNSEQDGARFTYHPTSRAARAATASSGPPPRP